MRPIEPPDLRSSHRVVSGSDSAGPAVLGLGAQPTQGGNYPLSKGQKRRLPSPMNEPHRSRQGWDKTQPVLINIGITTGLVLYRSWTFSLQFGQAAPDEIDRRKDCLALGTGGQGNGTGRPRAPEVPEKGSPLLQGEAIQRYAGLMEELRAWPALPGGGASMNGRSTAGSPDGL